VPEHGVGLVSQLQWALLAVGAAIVAVVVAYNAWQLRRSKPHDMDRPLEPEAAVEPKLDWLDDTTLPELAQHVIEQDDAVTWDGGVLNALIDTVVPVAFEQHISGDAVCAAMPATRRIGSKPLAIEVQVPDDPGWWQPRPGMRVCALRAGLQMANRSGAMNEIEFSEFVAVVQRLADTLGGAPDFADMMTEVGRARELDQFASQHDAQLAFVLQTQRAAWSLGFVLHAAGQVGFQSGSLPGRMVLPAADGSTEPPVLTLLFDTQVALAEQPHDMTLRRLRLVYDVAHVPIAERGYARMQDVAHALLEPMDADLVDDAGQPLTAAALAQIGQDVEQLCQTLAERELAPGSAVARRLFS